MAKNTPSPYADYPIKFHSVYDHIAGYGRTKSVSYRLFVAARAMAVWLRANESKESRKRYRAAVKKLKAFRWKPSRCGCGFGG